MLPSSKACSHCGTSMSLGHPWHMGDTFVTQWTDGCCGFLRYSRNVRTLRKCPNWGCGKLSWEDEMSRGEPSDVSDAHLYFDDYHQHAKRLLDEGDRDSAFQALILGFWEVNGPMRTVSHSNYFVTSYIAFRHRPKTAELLGRLEVLLDLSVAGDVLLAAELAREQGRYDRSLEILKSLKGEEGDLGRFSNVIRECAERQLAIVRPVSFY